MATSLPDARRPRWVAVASVIAPILVAVALAALVVIPVLSQRHMHRFTEGVTQLAEPSRYLLDTIAVTTSVQSRASRGARTFEEQHTEYARMYESASSSQKRALEELLSLTRDLDKEAHASARRLADALAAWRRPQEAHLAGEMTAEAYWQQLPAQDARFERAVDEWTQLSGRLRALAEEHRRKAAELDRAEALITSSLALGALIALVLVLWLARRARSLEAAVARRELAERSSSARAEVLAQVSHDLRSPLMAIVASVGVVHRAPGGRDPLVQRAMERIENSTRRMTRLVGDLLDHARLAAGKGLGMNALDVDVEPIVLRCREEAVPERPERIRCHVDEQARRVIADPDRLEQVLMNLLNNALKFSPPGAAVELDVRAEGDTTVFRVSDSGPGIAAEERPYLFEPFWQSQSTRRPGYGLGLPIARAIVEAHGGRIWLERGDERGSTFAFSLPRA